MNISLIITTYNDPIALELVLKSALAQTRMPDEIVIGDDGSTEATRELIDRYRPLFPVPLKHIWQEDKGFRKSRILNKALAATTGEYIVEIDGDIIMHPRFIEDHERMSRPGYYLKGGRCMLGQKLSADLRSCAEIPTFRPWTKGISSKRANALRLPLLASYLAPRYAQNKRGLGCNLSYYRQDFIDVNGYDEFFEGWGGEDNDFLRRLTLKGLGRRHLKFIGLAYHLWHKENSRENYARNDKHSTRDDGQIRCVNGCDKYL